MIEKQTLLNNAISKLRPLENSTDRNRLLKFLLTNWQKNAYLLANLDVSAHPSIQWYVQDGPTTTSGSDIISVVATYKGYRVLTAGDPVILDDIGHNLIPKHTSGGDLIVIVGDERTITHIPQGYHKFEPEGNFPDPHHVLSLNEADFVAQNLREKVIYSDKNIDRRATIKLQQKLGISIPDDWIIKPIVFNENDLALINILLGDAPSQFQGLKFPKTEDVFVDPDRIKNGLPYLVLLDGENAPVSLIGCHGRLPEAQLALIGDAYTRPDSRNKGYQSLMTAVWLNAQMDQGCDKFGAEVATNKSWSRTAQRIFNFRQEGTIYYQKAYKVLIT